MNIFTVKDGKSELSINVDQITHMELSEGNTEEEDQLKVSFVGGTDFIFTNDAARMIQFEIDTIMAKLSQETAVAELA